MRKTKKICQFAECPLSDDGMERFACPTTDRMGRYRCIDDHVICDGFYDCPGGEDEDRQECMFYKTVSTTINIENYVNVPFSRMPSAKRRVPSSKCVRQAVLQL